MASRSDQPDRPFVLIVDDDAGIRAMLEMAFSSRGFRVDAIGDRDEGWSGRPDVVLLDARLRTESAADFLAAAPFGDDVPVVLVTADQAAEQIARDVGAAACVRKPFDLDELFGAIDAAIARRAPTGTR